MSGQSPIYWVAQSIGVAAFIIFFWSAGSVSRKATVGGRGLSAVLFTVQFVLLGNWAIAGIAGSNAVRGLTMAATESKRIRSRLMWVFLAINIALFVFVTGSFESWLTVLPLVATIMSTIAFSLARVSRIKAIGVISTIAYVSYYISQGLFVNVVGDSIAMILSAVAWRRAVRIEAEADRETPRLDIPLPIVTGGTT